MTKRTWFVVAITVLAIASALLIPAEPQPLAYHEFADQREAFGIPNFLNVVSNFAFFVVGVWGLVASLGRRAKFQFSVERWPYVVFFTGVLLTSAGSSYYHWAPDNESLFWDRLPMTIAFMALVSSQIVDRISIRAGLGLLIPMLILGAASVVYWRVTERAGAGNVVPYAVLQGYSVVIMLAMATLPSRYTQGNRLYWVFAWYVLSKILEAYDAEILAWGHVVSGHTLKHFAAAVAGVPVCLMLMRRTLVETNSNKAPLRADEAAPRAMKPGPG